MKEYVKRDRSQTEKGKKPNPSSGSRARGVAKRKFESQYPKPWSRRAREVKTGGRIFKMVVVDYELNFLSCFFEWNYF